MYGQVKDEGESQMFINSEIRLPIPIQVTLALRRNDLNPQNPSLLTTDLPILLTVRDIELIDSPVRSRHTVQSSHSSPRLISRRQIDKK